MNPSRYDPLLSRARLFEHRLTRRLSLSLLRYPSQCEDPEAPHPGHAGPSLAATVDEGVVGYPVGSASSGTRRCP
jgi:hypothetical protein